MMKILLLFMLAALNAHSGIYKAWELLEKNKDNYRRVYPQVAQELIDDGFYYAAIPVIKEYLVLEERINNRLLDDVLERLIREVGVRQFEVLPISVLEKSKSPSMRFILAKKLFRKRDYQNSLRTLSGSIPKSHFVKPFALELEGSNYSLLGNESMAVQAFEECVDASEKAIRKTAFENHQLEMNRDFCIVGIPRAHFGRGNYKKAYSNYLDLPKTAYIWPEILFEEAWTSFYLRDFNRSLGKIVTYKAPGLEYIFNPEVNILEALTYFELCLYNDAMDTVDEFQTTYEAPLRYLRSFLARHGNDYRYYYQLGATKMSGKVRGDSIFNNMLDYIIRDPAFREMNESFAIGVREIARTKSIKSAKIRYFLRRALKESLFLERNLIGGYVRKKLSMYVLDIEKYLTGMSYIKLEILSSRKKELYRPGSGAMRVRGDIKNLIRTSKQYFFTFNGEFWADELGDYVFSLESACGNNDENL